MLTRFPRLSARYWRCAATLLLALTASLASAAPRTLDTAFGEVTLTGTPERVSPCTREPWMPPSRWVCSRSAPS